MADFFTASAHELWYQRNNRIHPDFIGGSKGTNIVDNYTEEGINESELVEDLLVHHSVAISKEAVAVHGERNTASSHKHHASVTDKSVRELFLSLKISNSLPLTDEDLKRFLRARKNDVPKAATMVREYLKWFESPIKGMEDTTPATILHSHETLEDIFKWKKHFPFAYCGHDKTGCPIYWEKAGFTIANYPLAKAAGITEDILVWHHILKEEHVTRVGMKHASAVYKKEITQQLAVCDMSGIKLGLDTATLAYFIRATAIDQNFYPGRLKKFIIFNAPWFFKSIWTAVRPFLGPSTQSRFIILREGEDYLSVLKKYIDSSQIPAEFGGNNKIFEFDSDVRHLDSVELCRLAISDVNDSHLLPDVP